jgi:hypothetical protein
MLQRIKNALTSAIAAIYHFIWAHIFQPKEPWTSQFNRMEEAYSLVFWFMLDVAVIAFWELLRLGGWWQIISNHVVIWGFYG